MSKTLQGAAAQAALARAAAMTMASVVLADPGQQPNSGMVLSLAPLMAANAEVDRSHPKWLHVHVRPPVRGLLKLLKVTMAVTPRLIIKHRLQTCVAHGIVKLDLLSCNCGCFCVSSAHQHEPKHGVWFCSCEACLVHALQSMFMIRLWCHQYLTVLLHMSGPQASPRWG